MPITTIQVEKYILKVVDTDTTNNTGSREFIVEKKINKNVLPLKIAFLCLFVFLKPHLQTKYKHSFAIDRTKPPLLE